MDGGRYVFDSNERFRRELADCVERAAASNVKMVRSDGRRPRIAAAVEIDGVVSSQVSRRVCLGDFASTVGVLAFSWEK